MSADSTIPLEGLSDVREALGTVRTIYGECAEFFSGVFSRLESVSDAMKARELARDRQLGEFKRQQQLWDQERTILEHELETVRNRAAELSESLAQQKRDAEMQQNQWAAEFKRMREMLQEMACRMAEGGVETAAPAPTENRSHGHPSGSDGADPVLNSVMAQFQILQSDAARRRKTREQQATHHPPGNGDR